MVLIDDSLLEAASISEQELKVELALMLYAQQRLSFGQARKLADMGYYEFEKLLFDRHIASHYDIEEFKEDIKTVEILRRDSNQ